MITISKLYSRELFHSYFVLFMCISTYSLYKDKGFSSPETYWENKTYKLKTSINHDHMALALWQAALTDS